MSHADSLAALNATAKAAATKEAKKKEREAIEKKEKEEKMKEVSEKKKRDAARSKAEQEAKEKEAKKKEHDDIMDLNNLDEPHEEEEDSTSKALFVEEGNSPVQKRIKQSISTLKSKQRYTNTTASKKIVNLQKYTQFIDFGVTLTTNDKSGEFSVKVKDLLMNLQLLDETAGLVELVPRQENQPKIISQEVDIPTNFTQLGQFIVFSGDGIFKIQKKWNNNNGKQTKHRDDDEDKQVFSKAAYGTARITSTMESGQLIQGVVNEW
jgi:hypothetical protein